MTREMHAAIDPGILGARASPPPRDVGRAKSREREHMEAVQRLERTRVKMDEKLKERARERAKYTEQMRALSDRATSERNMIERQARERQLARDREKERACGVVDERFSRDVNAQSYKRTIDTPDRQHGGGGSGHARVRDMFQDMQHLMKSGVGDTPDGGHVMDKDLYRHVDLQEFQNMQHLAQSGGGGGGGGGLALSEKRNDVFSEFDLFEVVLACARGCAYATCALSLSSLFLSSCICDKGLRCTFSLVTNGQPVAKG